MERTLLSSFWLGVLKKRLLPDDDFGLHTVARKERLSAPSTDNDTGIACFKGEGLASRTVSAHSGHRDRTLSLPL